MLLVAPLSFACLAYTWFVYRLRGLGNPAPYREAILWTTLAAGVATLVITEGLGLFNALSRLAVFLAWTALAAVATALLIRSRLPLRLRLPSWESPRGWGVFAVFGLAAILLPTLLIAIFAPPNNFDSMTYHMPRIMRWIENGNVDFFATNNYRQLWPFPWAEYAILQPQLLWGNDRFANLVQWWAGILSVIGASLIVQLFDRRALAQWLGAIVCATVPMAILQSTSTQNDLVTGSWLVCFIYFMLRAGTESRHGVWYYISAGFSLGLGGMSKPTVLLYAAPIFLWAMWLRRRSMSVRTMAGATVIVGILSLLVVSPQLARNTNFYGSPSGPTGDRERPDRMINDEFSLPIMLSNALRNTTLHTRTPWDSVNQAQFRFVKALHGYLGVAIDDERNTFLPAREYRIRKYLLHEDEAGNPFHALLFVLGLPAAAWLAIRNPAFRKVFLYGVALLAGFLLMCLLVRWSIWRSRYHLPLFVAAAPFIAIVFGAVLRGRFLGPLCALLVFSSVPFVFDNPSRPLRGPRSVLTLNRQEAMFNNRPYAWGDFQEIFGRLEIANCRNVGLFLHGDGWEYPFRTMAAAMTPPARIQIVGVTNPTSRFLPPVFDAPCAVVSNKVPGDIYDAEEIVYRKVWHSKAYSLFLR